jgi:hypothetical protein
MMMKEHKVIKHDWKKIQHKTYYSIAFLVEQQRDTSLLVTIYTIITMMTMGKYYGS